MTKLFYWGLFFCALSINPVFAADDSQKAAQLAEKGQTALAEERLQEALDLFVQAAKLDTKNDEYFSFAALVSESKGDVAAAIDFYKQARDRAAAQALSKNIQAYNQSIDVLLATLPAWAEEKSTQAAQLTVKQEVDYQAWQGLMEQVIQSFQAEKPDQAATQLQEALAFAKEKFGDNHMVMLLTLQQQAELQEVTGDLPAALATIEKTIKVANTTLSERHHDTLSLLETRARLQQASGDIAAALKTWQMVVAQYAIHLGNSHPFLFGAELNHARIYTNKADYEVARPLLTNLCPRIQDVYGAAHAMFINCLQQSIDVDVAQGNYAVAEKNLNQLITLQQQLAGERATDVLSSRAELASIYRFKGDLKQAEIVLQDVLNEGKGSWEQQDDVERLSALAYLAQVYEDQSKFKKATDIMDEILAYQQANLGDTHPNTLATTTGLGGLYRRLGQFAESEKTFRSAIKGYESTLGKEHPATLNTYNNLALTLENQGLYNESEPLMKQAYRGSIKQLGAAHPSTIATMNNLALLHESQGVFKKAEPLYVEAIEQLTKKFSKDHPDTLAAANNLAYLHLLQEQFEEAAKGFEQVSAEWTKQLGEKHQKTLKAINNLARSYQGLGLNDKAEPLFKKALKLRSEVLGEKHIDTLRSMRDLGEFYRVTKKNAKARTLLEKVLKIDEKVLGEQHPYTFEALNSLADLEESEGKLAKALALRQKGFARRTKFLSTMLPVTGSNAREGYIRLHRPELSRYINLLAKKAGKDGGKAALEVSLQRKGLLLKVSSEQRQIMRLLRNSKLGETAKQLNASRKELAALTLSGPTLETRDTHLKKIHDLEEKIESLEGDIGRASPRFSRSISAYTVERLEKYLPESAVLVDFWAYSVDGKNKMIAGIMNKDSSGQISYGFAHYDDLDALQVAIKEYRELIQDEDADDDDIKGSGLELYSVIWEPLTDYIQQSSEKSEKSSKKTIQDKDTEKLETANNKRPIVYIVPDGLLNILPFNALVNEDEEYLINALDLRVLTSSRDLLPAPAYPPTKGVLIMAGPDYDSKEVTDEKVLKQLDGKRSTALSQGLRAASNGMRGLKFDPLPGAEKEGELIDSTIAGIDKNNKSTIFLKSDAQEQTLQAIKKAPRILHVATHGFFLEPDDTLRKRLLKMQRGADINIPPPGDNPLLRAGLAFAGINSNAPYLGEIDTENDGVLTALEVLDLNLSGTELAVLSACETGLGEIHEGEGIYGLRRAFQEVGVKTVIASLWEVSDAGTQALMTKLYDYLLKGQTPRQALDSAQRDLMASDDWNYPYIWSAFMIVGR